MSVFIKIASDINVLVAELHDGKYKKIKSFNYKLGKLASIVYYSI